MFFTAVHPNTPLRRAGGFALAVIFMESAFPFTARMVETLYCDALLLADEARAQFQDLHAAQRRDVSREMPTGDTRPDHSAELAAHTVALSCESLRATTRIMHSIAWLLNHKAFFAGEISEAQLRNHGQLIGHCPPVDAQALALFKPVARAVVMESEMLYARILRLEQAWQDSRAAPVIEQSVAVHAMQDQIRMALTG